MASKKVLFACLIAAVVLCLVQAVFLIKLRIPETRFNVKTIDRSPSLATETVPEQNKNQPVNAEPLAEEPGWRLEHHNLYFLESDDNVEVIETGVKNQLFALRSPGPSGFGSYNLWFVPPNGRAKLISGESMTECDSIDIAKTGDYIFTDFMTSPCEAGTRHTLSYYRANDGSLAYTLSYGTGFGTGSAELSVASGTKTQTIGITPVWSGSCEVPMERREEANGAPQIEFTGVTVSLNDGKKIFYTIGKKRSVFCEEQYGGGFDYPGINNATLADGKANFTTSFGVSMNIDLNKISASPSFDVVKTVWPSDKPDASFLQQEIASQIAFAQVPVLLIKDKDVGNMQLFTHRNGSTEFSGKRGHYYINLYQRLDQSTPRSGNTNIKVRGSDVTITGTDSEYNAKWKENNTAYELIVHCSEDDRSACRTEDEIKDLLKEIVYVGGNYE